MIARSRIDAWRGEAAGWWAVRSARERRLLAAFAIVFGIALLLGLVVRPLQASRADARAALRLSDAIEAQARAAGTGAASGTQRTGDTAAIARASAAAYSVGLEVVATGGSAARVRIVSAPYEAFVRWLADLGRSSGVRVERLAMQPAAAPGAVAAELVLTQ